MGQYYRAVILSESGEIIAWFSPHAYGSYGMLDEHSTAGDAFVFAVEKYLHEHANKQFKLVWAGDFSSTEPKREGDIWSQCKTNLTAVRDAIDIVIEDAYIDDDISDLAEDAKQVLESADFSAIPNTPTLEIVNRCLDYALQKNLVKNLYEMCSDLPDLEIRDGKVILAALSYQKYPRNDNYSQFRYLVNHTKKLIVDKFNLSHSLHPLPGLASSVWARDVICASNERPEGYTD
jgi:hypothetical protein